MVAGLRAISYLAVAMHTIINKPHVYGIPKYSDGFLVNRQAKGPSYSALSSFKRMTSEAPMIKMSERFYERNAEPSPRPWAEFLSYLAEVELGENWSGQFRCALQQARVAE